MAGKCEKLFLEREIVEIFVRRRSLRFRLRFPDDLRVPEDRTAYTRRPEFFGYSLGDHPVITVLIRFIIDVEY